MKLKCTLCEQEITNYKDEYNHLKISDSKSINICLECLNKIVKWQAGIYMKLFPTSRAKKHLKSKNEYFPKD